MENVTNKQIHFSNNSIDLVYIIYTAYNLNVVLDLVLLNFIKILLSVKKI